MPTPEPDRVICVRPSAGAWLVAGASEGPQLFVSGAEAEHWARRQAQALARDGGGVVVEIVLRDGRLAGRLRFGSDGGLARARALEPA